jgi:hypothetical protein
LDPLAESTLDDLYKATYNCILQDGNTTKEIALRSFAWLLSAQAQLSPGVFLSAIAMRDMTIDSLLSICRGFVRADSQSNVLLFAHHSVREFLRLQATFEPGQAHRLVAARCLEICSDPHKPPSGNLAEFEPTTQIYDYEALHWGHHCSAQRLYPLNPVFKDVHEFLFDTDEPSLPFQIWMKNIRGGFGSLPREHPQKAALEFLSDEECSPLFTIWSFGFVDILERYNWPANFDWDQCNDHGQTALYAASHFSHTGIAALLLDRGANSNVQCGRLGSALHCAAFHGHSDVVKQFLNRGADLKLGSKFDSAIHAACRGNSEEVVLTVLDSGVGIATQDNFQQVREAISEAGFSRAIDMLCNHPLSATTSPSRALNMGRKAVKSGKVGILQCLLLKSTYRARGQRRFECSTWSR